MENNNNLIEKYSSMKNDLDVLLSQKESEWKRGTERDEILTVDLENIKGKLDQSIVVERRAKELEQKLHLASVNLQEVVPLNVS
jgi:hypothetical protein